MNTFFRMRLSEQDKEVKNFLIKRGYSLSKMFRNLMYELYEKEVRTIELKKLA